jgi:hypothetical protein
LFAPRHVFVLVFWLPHKSLGCSPLLSFLFSADSAGGHEQFEVTDNIFVFFSFFDSLFFLLFVNMEWLSKAGELLDKVRELSGRNNAVK